MATCCGLSFRSVGREALQYRRAGESLLALGNGIEEDFPESLSQDLKLTDCD